MPALPASVSFSLPSASLTKLKGSEACPVGRWNAASSWVLEAREIDTDKDNWSTKEGHGPTDGTDDGYVSGREFEFTKKTSTSRMLFSYNDNTRVYGSSKACRWEIHVDGASCPSGILAGDVYVVNDNNHRPHSLVGFCDMLAAGKHTIKIKVGQTPGYSGSDCYTGCALWPSSLVFAH